MFLENAMNPTQHSGWIEVICGSMFSLKTKELIPRLKRAQLDHLHVHVFKEAVDNRYDCDQVLSHDHN